MPVFEYLSSILMLLGSLVGMFCGIVFIGVLTVNRHCRTSTTFFGLNSVIAGLITTFVYACQACYQLSSARRDALCVFRGFLLHATCGLLYHTFCIQAFYRLLVTIPTRRLYFRSRGVIKLLVLVQWLISATFGLPILCRGQIKFHASGRICQVSVHDIYGFLYLSTWIYLLPLVMIIAIYVRVLVYIQKQSVLDRQRRKRELRLHRRIFIPIFTLFVMGFPYLTFFIVSQFAHVHTPSYTLRICFVFISLSQGITMILCVMHTDSVRKYLINSIRRVRRRRHRRRVHCIDIVPLPVQIVPVHQP